MQSSLLKLFSFKILIILFLFLIKQLSISSENPQFSLRLTNFKISSVVRFFPPYAYLLIFSISLLRLCLSPLHLLTIKLMFCCEIEIFSFLKKIEAILDSVSLLSGQTGIQIRFLFFSNKILSLDFFSRIPESIIIFILSISLSINSSIISKILLLALLITIIFL